MKNGYLEVELYYDLDIALSDKEMHQLSESYDPKVLGLRVCDIFGDQLHHVKEVHAVVILTKGGQ